MMRQNFPPAYYKYQGADTAPSTPSTPAYYGMQYRVSETEDHLNHQIRIIPIYFHPSLCPGRAFQ